LPFVNVTAAENIPAYIRLVRVPVTPIKCYNTIFNVYNMASNPLENTRINVTSQCLPKKLVAITNAKGYTNACLSSDCAVKAEILHDGYAPQSFTFTPTEEDHVWPVYLKSILDSSVPQAPIASGTIIILDNIYYDFNKSAIRKSDAGELNALANILKQYPNLTIELTSHTDTRGSAEYNLELSQKRSESSKKYLVLLGVDESRIVTKAAGESMPRNRCIDNVPCSEAEHQFNRRTEVRILNPADEMEIRYKSGDQ
jgi:outer membrane protein OmpA-like peptidoglycan-associated protein